MKQAAIILTAMLAVSSQANSQAREPAEIGGTERASTPVNGQEAQIEMYRVSPSGIGDFIGTIRVTNRLEGIHIKPNLEMMPPGIHGFHIHENPSCETETREREDGTGPRYIAAGAAGDHLDPGWTGNHSGPYGAGHVGDLPNLFVSEEGVAEHPVFAPRVKLMDVEGRSLVIHAQPDNYSDDPENGGSGARIACGVLP